MNNDDNSIQQNLPLSWDDSEQNIEETLQPKPLLLKKAPEQQIQEMNDYEEASKQNIEEKLQPKPLLLKKAAEPEPPAGDSNEEINSSYDEETPSPEVIVAPRPLLLKKAAEVQEEQQDVEESNSEEETEAADDFEDYESEMDEETVDYSEYSDPDKKTISYLKVLQESTEETNSEPETSSERRDAITTDSVNENTSETNKLEADNSIEAEADFENQADPEASSGTSEEIDISDEYTEEQQSNIDDILDSKPEDILATDSTPLFEETGTFSLEHEPEEDEESENQEDQSDAEEDSRLEIEEDTLEDSIEDRLAEETESDKNTPTTAEESVFALKAETYYEIESEQENDVPDSPEITNTDESEELKESSTAADITTHDSFQTLGALLQEARLAKSFTIKDASEVTRIKSSYIISLENNELDELPARVYILNYIRQLAREYDISHTPLIESYERQVGENESGDQHVMSVGDDDARKATKPASKLNTIIVITAFLLLGILLFAAYYMKWLNPQTSLADHPTVEINLDSLKEEIKLPTPEFPVPEK
ncbi:MAG: helix-turn-helix domain-containing protein [Lentisphaerales bacterium]|nr:helix-turn-helix domain-containing protein [Lentisphaerales bacterium]